MCTPQRIDGFRLTGIRVAAGVDGRGLTGLTGPQGPLGGREPDPQGRGDVGKAALGGLGLPAGPVLEEGDQDQDEDHARISPLLRAHRRGAITERRRRSAVYTVHATTAEGVVMV